MVDMICLPGAYSVLRYVDGSKQWGCMEDEMLPPEHMERMYKMLLANKGRVTWAPVHAGHMDAYETAAQASAGCTQECLR